MSDLPERFWVWRNEPGNEVVISAPDQPYPTGSPEYVRKDIADAAVTDAVRDVLAERKRQISDEGWTPEHDDAYQAGDLANAAACYAMTDPVLDTDQPGRVDWPYAPQDWPWPAIWWKPTNRRRDLVKAGALILAEIERLDRAALAQKGSA
jgi:hypothetical protein